MDKTDYFDKMDAFVNDKQTYEELKRDPTPALQRKLNSKILMLKKTDAIDTQRYYRLRCSVPQPPKLYGLPKLHKPGIPMRPIVSFCGSPTYQLSRYLTTILQPLTDKSRRKLQSTENFIDAIKTVQIPDDYKLVSFDVKSLFTSIPLQLALQCTETAIQQYTVKLPLPTEDIMDLLNLCLTSTYFQYNGKHYKQLHGTAMGSPVSVVAVYKIKCSDCQASYIGETGRNLNTRLTEHKRATRNGDANNHIAVHHQLTNHNIDWDSAQCLTYSTNYFQRLTLESWYTNLEQMPLNRCQQLPPPYKRLIHDRNETDKRTSNRPTYM